MTLATPATTDTQAGSKKRVRTRFAPSPTGFLHVGAFRTALFSWLWAKKNGGDFILRIEDTDQARLVPGALESIIASLLALGLVPDEGPDAAQVTLLDADKYGSVRPNLLPANGGAFGPYFQSLRRERYNELLEQLLESGHAYYAFETSAELDALRAAADARKMPYRYSGKFRDYPLADARERVASGEGAVIRLKMPTTGEIRCEDFLRGPVVFAADTQDDFIIKKTDGLPPYHFAAIADDHDMEVSHVLRGEEWLPSFPKHVALYEAFGWEQPVWVHTPNVLGADKKKLSKRHGAAPLLGPVPEYENGKLTGKMLDGMVNQEGFLPEALLNFLALIGWSTPDNREVMPLADLIAEFSLERISQSPGVFDKDKLEWMNGVYIRSLSPSDLVQRVLPFLQEKNLVAANPTDAERAYIAEVITLEQERIKTLADVPEVTGFFFGELPDYSTDDGQKAVRKWLQKDSVAVGAYLSDVRAAYQGLADWSVAAIEEATRAVGAAHGRAAGNITHPVRVATTGREAGPGLFELIAVLGKERTMVRLARAIELTAEGR